MSDTHYSTKYYRGDYKNFHISMYDYFPDGGYHLLRKSAVEDFIDNCVKIGK